MEWIYREFEFWRATRSDNPAKADHIFSRPAAIVNTTADDDLYWGRIYRLRPGEVKEDD